MNHKMKTWLELDKNGCGLNQNGRGLTNCGAVLLSLCFRRLLSKKAPYSRVLLKGLDTYAAQEPIIILVYFRHPQ